MSAPTKAELREQIDAAGLEQPPKSATRDDLVDVLKQAADGGTAVEHPRRGRANASMRRCPAGRPLLTDVCRRCHLAGATTCPGPTV